MLKITAVSYLNTLPFIFGIKNSGLLKDYQLTLVPPANCATHMIDGKADIALVPIGALPNIKNVQLITDYCIGADGMVQSVLLLSNKPLHEITTVSLDMQSRTSVVLTCILAKEFWKIKINTTPLDITQLSISQLPETIVCIGDKTFEWQQHFAYKYDLAAEWKKFTGLPFVFACWIATTNVSKEIINTFNEALRYGIDHKKESIQDYLLHNTQAFNLDDYLNNAISYNFDNDKKTAMKMFFKYLTTTTQFL